jgi:hypothetical protein
MMMDWKGFGRKRSWPIVFHVLTHSLAALLGSIYLNAQAQGFSIPGQIKALTGEQNTYFKGHFFWPVANRKLKFSTYLLLAS